MSIGLEATTASQLLPPPLRAPVYRLDRTFEDNAASGPSFFGAYPKVPATPLKDFFGHVVGSRFGIAASLIMNARWFELYSRLGFDLLTYKTIRSRARKATSICAATPSCCLAGYRRPARRASLHAALCGLGRGWLRSHARVKRCTSMRLPAWRLWCDR